MPFQFSPQLSIFLQRCLRFTPILNVKTDLNISITINSKNSDITQYLLPIEYTFFVIFVLFFTSELSEYKKEL